MHKGNPTSADFMFLLFLIIAPVSPVCRIGTAVECEGIGRLPGSEHVGVGYDITTLMETPLNALDMYHRAPNGTCKLCHSKYMRNLKTVPFNIDQWKDLTKCSEKVTKSEHTSVSSVSKMQESVIQGIWKNDFTVRVPRLFSSERILTGSHSEMLQFSTTQSIQKNNVYLRREISCKVFSATVVHNPKIRAEFENEIADLPEKYNCTTRPKYFEIIRRYGTHFVSEVNLGGYLRFLTSVERCKLTFYDLSAAETNHCLAVLFSQSVTYKGVEGGSSSSLEICKKKAEQIDFLNTFASNDEDQYSEVHGGDPTFGISALHDHKHYNDWVESLKIFPDIVSPQIISIHTLVAKQNPRYESLQKAVIDYIMLRSLVIGCKKTCPNNYRASFKTDCLCPCTRNDENVNEYCCAKKRFLGYLTVWIDYARDLHGDWFTKTDAFVEVTFQKKAQKTSIVWDDDNPDFNAEFSYGAVQLLQGTATLKVVVKESDPWGISELGSCDLIVGSGQIQEKICNLAHGHLKYRYRVVCGPSLGGSQCESYVSQAPTFSGFYAKFG